MDIHLSAILTILVFSDLEKEMQAKPAYEQHQVHFKGTWLLILFPSLLPDFIAVHLLIFLSVKCK